MNRTEKANLVSSLRSNLEENSFIAIVHYRGMNDKQLYDMRVALRNKNCAMKIAKNKLINVALKDSSLTQLAPYLKGPVAVLYSQDPVALSKVISDTAKNCEFLKPKVALFNNSLIGELEIENLAKLGSLEDVRASFIYTLNAVQSSIVSLLQNYSAKKEEENNLS